MTAAAAASGLNPKTYTARWRRARDWAEARGLPIPKLGRWAAPAEKPFTIDPLPTDLLTADELIANRIKAFARLDKAKQARQLIPVKVQIDGPFGIAHFGDPHVDDNGTDVALLKRHVELVNQTEGLFAANVGDITNNWVGRLARLYGEQSVSAREAWLLAEWLVTSVRWLYIISGNHDQWSGAGDPLQWITRQARALYEAHGARLELQCPNGRRIRINARHDFKGHSMWNTAHGPAKAATMGWRDHLLTCGHTHVSGYQVVKDPATGLISHAIRVASYKTHDRYADEKGLPNQNIFVCPVTIVDPRRDDHDPRQITTIFDPETGADFLRFLRRRKG